MPAMISAAMEADPESRPTGMPITHPILEPLEILEAQSEDEEGSDDDDGFDATDAGSIVGVSIGKEQLRLTSPSTPAAEKSAALDRMNSWGFFGGADEEIQAELLANTLKNTRPSTEIETADGVRLPSLVLDGDQPLRSAVARNRSQSEALKQPFEYAGGRQRGGGIINFLGDASVKKFLANLNFNPLPDGKGPRHRPSSSLGGIREDLDAFGTRRGRSSSLFNKISWAVGPIRSDSSSSPSHQPEQGLTSLDASMKTTAASQKISGSNPVSTAAAEPMPKPASIRRSASDDSLLRPAITRQSTISANSFLGEQTAEWENIKQQVNSRRKAIRDSLQDSLPQMPNINFSTLRPDLAFRNLLDIERSASRSISSLGLRDTVTPGESLATPKLESRSSSPPKMITSRTPVLDAALEKLTGDIVILGGYRGSVLRSAEHPYRQLWVPVKVGLNIRKVNLEVGLNAEDEDSMHKRIKPSGMLTHIGPVDMSRRLFRRLRSCPNAKNGSLRVWNYGYDWRLSPALLSRRLIKFLEGLPSNSGERKLGATVISHSLGGLITRHAVNQRPELFAGVVYAGTPQHCVNILGPLRNGDAVLLSSKVLTAQVNFTFRTSFLLLPESGHCFFHKTTKEQYPVNFFDPDNWQRHALSPCIAPVYPPFTPPERKSLFGSISSSIPSLLSSSMTSTVSKQSHHPPTPPAAAEEQAAKLENLAQPGEGSVGMSLSPPVSPAAISTLPLEEAQAYLRRTLAATVEFKRELRHQAALEAQNRYPPHALIYGTSVPTVYGARVASREAIRHSDAYDDLAFASGDGVVLARAALLPRGYQTVEGGRVRTERGHVGILGDVEAVGKCLMGLIQARAEGVGLGVASVDVT